MCCFVYVSLCRCGGAASLCYYKYNFCSKVVVASEEYITDWDYNVVKKYLNVYITVSVYFWSLNVHIFLFLSQTPSHITASGLTVHHSYCNLRNMKKKFSWGKFISILGFQIVLTMFWYSNQSRMTKHSVLKNKLSSKINHWITFIWYIWTIDKRPGTDLYVHFNFLIFSVFIVSIKH